MTTGDPNRPRTIDRRRFLGTAGAGLAVGATGSLPGCLSSLPTLGQRIRYEPVDVPAPGDPVYRDWIPAPGPEDDYEWGDRMEVYLTPQVLDAASPNASSVLAIQERLARSTLDYVGVGFGNYENVFQVGSAVVALGAFERETVREAVLEMGYEEIGDDDGDAGDGARGTDGDETDDAPPAGLRFRRSNPAAVLAVLDGVVVFDPEPEQYPAVDAVVDAGMGRRERLHEVDDAFETLTETIGSQPGLAFTGSGEVGDPYGFGEERAVRQSATTTAFDAAHVYTQVVQVFEADLALTEQRVKEHLEHSDRAVDADRVEVTIDGATVTVAMKQHLDDQPWYDEDVRSPPQISWWFDHDESDETVTVDHRGGDAADADDLTIGFGGLYPDTFVEPQFDDEFDVVEPGDSIVVDVSDRPADAAELTIVDQPDDRGSRIAVGAYPFG